VGFLQRACSQFQYIYLAVPSFFPVALVRCWQQDVRTIYFILFYFILFYFILFYFILEVDYVRNITFLFGFDLFSEKNFYLKNKY